MDKISCFVTSKAFHARLVIALVIYIVCSLLQYYPVWYLLSDNALGMVLRTDFFRTTIALLAIVSQLFLWIALAIALRQIGSKLHILGWGIVACMILYRIVGLGSLQDNPLSYNLFGIDMSLYTFNMIQGGIILVGQLLQLVLGLGFLLKYAGRIRILGATIVGMFIIMVTTEAVSYYLNMQNEVSESTITFLTGINHVIFLLGLAVLVAMKYCFVKSEEEKKDE